MDIMNLLSSGVLRALGVAAIAFLALIYSMFFHGNQAMFVANGTQLLEGGLALATAGAGVWAVVARVALPNPPLTQGAADAHTALLAAQGTPIVASTPTETVVPIASSSKISAHWMAVMLAVLVVSALMAGCQSEPVAAANTPGQKAAALLGDFNIYEAASLSIGQNTAIPIGARRAVLDAAIAAKPVADSAQAALTTYRQVTTALSAGTTTQDKVLIAATNLQNWITQLSTLVTSLVAAEKGATTP